MSLSRRMLLLGSLVLSCTSCGFQEASPPSQLPEQVVPLPEQAVPQPSLPDWLGAEIKVYESEPFDHVPSEIWRIQHKGQPAFFVLSGCCDQYDPLLSASGEELCNPSGGHTGGDGKCPTPADPGTPITFVWAHPAAHPGRYYVPSLDCGMDCAPLKSSLLSSLPHWLATKIKRFEHLPIVNSDFKQLWLIQHKGQPAYYAVSGRLYDDLYSVSGELLCKPTGGDDGLGDGKCPWPADPGTEVTIVWVHPQANPKDTAVPRLTNRSIYRTK